MSAVQGAKALHVIPVLKASLVIERVINNTV